MNEEWMINYFYAILRKAGGLLLFPENLIAASHNNKNKERVKWSLSKGVNDLIQQI